MSLNVALFGDRVFTEMIKLKWRGVGGEAKEGMIHKKAERIHLEDHINCFNKLGEADDLRVNYWRESNMRR